MGGLDPRAKLNQLVESYFGLFGSMSNFISVELFEEVQAQAAAFQAQVEGAQQGFLSVLSQIYEVVVGVSAFLVPDLSKEELPESALDY